MGFFLYFNNPKLLTPLKSINTSFSIIDHRFASWLDRVSCYATEQRISRNTFIIVCFLCIGKIFDNWFRLVEVFWGKMFHHCYTNALDTKTLSKFIRCAETELECTVKISRMCTHITQMSIEITCRCIFTPSLCTRSKWRCSIPIELTISMACFSPKKFHIYSFIATVSIDWWGEFLTWFKWFFEISLLWEHNTMANTVKTTSTTIYGYSVTNMITPLDEFRMVEKELLQNTMHISSCTNIIYTRHSEWVWSIEHECTWESEQFIWSMSQVMGHIMTISWKFTILFNRAYEYSNTEWIFYIKNGEEFITFFASSRQGFADINISYARIINPNYPSMKWLIMIVKSIGSCLVEFVLIYLTRLIISSTIKRWIIRMHWMWIRCSPHTNISCVDEPNCTSWCDENILRIIAWCCIDNVYSVIYSFFITPCLGYYSRCILDRSRENCCIFG